MSGQSLEECDKHYLNLAHQCQAKDLFELLMSMFIFLFPWGTFKTKQYSLTLVSGKSLQNWNVCKG